MMGFVRTEDLIPNGGMHPLTKLTLAAATGGSITLAQPGSFGNPTTLCVIATDTFHVNNDADPVAANEAIWPANTPLFFPANEQTVFYFKPSAAATAGCEIRTVLITSVSRKRT